MALLEIRNVTKSFGSPEAEKNVSIAIEAGELLLDGKPLAGIPLERRRIHTVFQGYGLFPHLTIAGDIAFPLESTRTFGRPDFRPRPITNA